MSESIRDKLLDKLCDMDIVGFMDLVAISVPNPPPPLRNSEGARPMQQQHYHPFNFNQAFLELRHRYHDLERTMSQFSDKIDAAVRAFESAIARDKDSVDAAKAESAALKTENDTLTAKIADLETQIPSAADLAALDKLKADADAENPSTPPVEIPPVPTEPPPPTV